MVRTLQPIRSLLTLLLLFALVPSPGAAEAVAPTGLTPAVQAELAQQLAAGGPGAAWPGSLAAFYRERSHQPAWLEDADLKPEAKVLIATLAQAPSQGLRPEQYHFQQLQHYRLATSAADLARLDLLLTDAYLRYCTDIQTGRTSPEAADQRWFIETEEHDHLAALDEALRSGTLERLLGNLHPRDPRYLRLRTTLARYRQIAAKGGWPRLRLDRTLEREEHHPTIPALRIRLALTDDLDGPLTMSDRYDVQLEQAVRCFQERHGLVPDGKLGPKTLKALNVPVSDRIAQILLNMERWRWTPRRFEERYLLVNMAAFELEAFTRQRSVLSMRVIIGRRYHSTPSFSEPMTHLVVNPYWNIPTKLAVRDFLPKLRRDPNALRRLGIRVFSEWSDRAVELDPATIDWQAIDPADFRYWLRQDPGPRNALGRIKFMLPNQFAIYLHDTPQRALFDRDVRAYSSGCIRVENPRLLADFVLGDQDQWATETLDALLESRLPKTIKLTEPLPVYLVYWTAWVDPDGTVQFRDDVYGRDQTLKMTLAATRGRP